MKTNLELLKEEFCDIKNEGMLKYLIPILEDFDKKINELEMEIIKILGGR